MKEELLGDIAGDKHIRVAVTIVISEGYAQAMTLFRSDTRCDTHILKCAVATIVVQNI
jgi:hypothetical protein